MTRLRHLVRRFLGALRPGGPKEPEARWVTSVLTPAELALWQKMPNHDRRHSVAVAHRVERELAGTEHADARWPAVALLHDVGKLDSGLGVIGRVGATLAGGVAGHDMAELWSQKRGITRRVGLYLRHPELGASRIRLAGGREEAARWAESHHDAQLRAALDFPAVVVTALYEADDD